ncbi:hypothetical protein MOQ_003608 [Trypanosoma cruzi marinkellei]|uniref:Uncharacterized protein n=1 Tax=Trypanosoma cruzi marinkellei TaxID=85056 RepID=K2N3Q1_TRYCR|nr:hypothetical protein MOQ_003608 [Trypanosoma cruzi marinkellei]
MNAENALVPWSAQQIFPCLEVSVEYRADLLATASRLPDVASRTLLCPLFHHRLLHQFAQSSVFGVLSSMCSHALTQQRLHEETSGNGFNGGKNNGYATEDEVKFAATVTSSLLEDSMINLDAALLPIIGNSQGHLVTILKKRLRETEENSLGVKYHEKSTLSMSTQKRITFVTRKRRMEKVRDQVNLPRRHIFSKGMASLTNVVQSAGFCERRELLGKLGDSPVPFQVRSREEVRQQLRGQKAFETSMTVVLSDHGVPLPLWKRRRNEVEEITENEGFTAPPTATSSTALDSPQESFVNATWVREGELLLVNGCLVHRDKKRMVEPSAKKEKTCALERGEIGSMETSETTSSVKKKTTAESERKKRTANVARGSFASGRIGTVNTQGVPLMSREEILALVNSLQISDALRAAFLIGLNGDDNSKIRQ